VTRPAPRRRRRDAGRPRGEPVLRAVLAHTLDEIARAGIDGVSVDRVARSAQVNKTSIYRRWPTREALVAAALGSIADEVRAQLPDTGSLRGDLEGLLAPVIRTLDTPVGQAVARAALSSSDAGPVAALAAARLGQGVPAALRALVERARARGEWRSGAAPEQVVFMLVGAALHRALLERAPLSARWLADLIDLIVQGVQPRDERAPLRGRGASKRRPRA
jgi:AcrR family transcriptional regulator